MNAYDLLNRSVHGHFFDQVLLSNSDEGTVCILFHLSTCQHAATSVFAEPAGYSESCGNEYSESSECSDHDRKEYEYPDDDIDQGDDTHLNRVKQQQVQQCFLLRIKHLQELEQLQQHSRATQTT